MTRNIAIVHYNTPELTMALVFSIRKNSPGCEITIFDNSDRRPFPHWFQGVNILDNTRGQILDFERFLSHFPNRAPSVNNWGSAKHIRTIDYLWDVFPDGFLLMDSDVLVKQDLSVFFDKEYPWVGEVHHNTRNNTVVRLLPYCLWMNVPVCVANGIRFMSLDRCDKLTRQGPWYDTGASFYEDCLKAELSGHAVPLEPYIEHLAMASFKRTPEAAQAWLLKYRHIYE